MCFLIPDPEFSFFIPCGINPSGLAITPDSRYAYVANNNSIRVQKQDSVSVVNLWTKEVIKTIHDPSFNQPYTITIDSLGRYAYVTNSDSTTVSVIDLITNRVTKILDGFDGPSGFVIGTDQVTAYVNNYGCSKGVGSGNGKTVSIVNLYNGHIIGTISVGQAPAGLVLNKDDNTLYCYNYQDGNPGTGTVSIIDTHTKIVVGTIYGFSGPFDMSLSPRLPLAYVTNFGSNNFNPIGRTVSVVDLTTRSIVKTLDVGIQPSGIVFSKDGRLGFVTNYNTLYQDQENYSGLTAGTGIISIIDTVHHKVLGTTLVTGLSPSNIELTPDGKTLVVSNYTSNTIHVFNI